MPSSKRIESSLARYHVIARGVGCMIFEDDDDRDTFLSLMSRALGSQDITTHAWCLMDNHYHLLLEGPLPRISKALRYLNSAYALAFNEEHARVGHLFQGRFKSEAIDSDEHFLTVLRYIHQNPVRAGMTTTCDYPWSSYRDYLTAPKLCDNSLTLELLGDGGAFLSLHEETEYEKVPLDIEERHEKLTAAHVIDRARAVLGDFHLESIAGMGRPARNEALRKLKDAGFSTRQIERLTGVSKSVVSRA